MKQNIVDVTLGLQKSSSMKISSFWCTISLSEYHTPKDANGDISINTFNPVDGKYVNLATKYIRLPYKQVMDCVYVAIHVSFPLQLSADNFSMREEITHLTWQHELTKNNIKREMQMLKLKMSSADIRARAMQSAIESTQVADKQTFQMTTCALLPGGVGYLW